ncbi:ATP-binding protein [Croceibacterium mercuriale]|uniref:ATP-binding protein n=1 Tax=Croceibacterium mercuriale TaxID=1572751 RepID=UPI0006893EEF|nr:ATP-binding protein [Croceibacterium mercuriale]
MTPARLLLAATALLLLPAAAPGPAAPTPAQFAFERAIARAKTAMMADPEAALAEADHALVRAAALSGDTGDVARATALWLRAEALIGLNRLTDANEQVAQALLLADRHAPRTKLQGDLMRARGFIAGERGRPHQSLTDLLTAFRLFRAAGEPRSQALALQDIGQIYWEAGDTERMLRYNRQAEELFPGDPAITLASKNTTGEALRRLGRWQEAEASFAAAMNDARELGSPLLQARVLGNLALAQVDGGKVAAAARNADRALALSRMAEAASWRSTVYGVMAKVAAAKGDNPAAARWLERTFAGLDLTRTDARFREFHEAAAQVYRRLGQLPLAYEHLAASKRIDSEASALTATASSQLMAAQFDFANQNLRIAQLKQGQLERDVQMERQRGRYRTNVFALLGSAAFVLLALMGWATWSIRRSRNQVRDANTVLTGVNAELEGALRAKTDFLAMTSHEIRTPLNGILGMTQVMLARPEIAGETREQVQLVHGAGETMRVLVDDILDLAKMEAGEIGVQLAPTRLQPILDDAVALWRARAAAKGLRLVAELTLGALPVETDGAKLRQILFNLLSNAIKFTATGEVRVLATHDPAAGHLMLAVEDTGIGIPADQQAHVFEAFHQVDSAMTRQFSGTGLGLAICRNLAGALGGTLTLASEPGHGSRFTLDLPVQEAIVEQSPPPQTLSAARIGIVEADPARRLKLAGLLRPHCAASLPLSDEVAALALLEDGGIDGLLVDAGACRPGTMARLRESSVPTILLVAGDSAEGSGGAMTVLAKPVSGAQLLSAVRGLFTQPLADAA